jgi:tRNA pseudouridine38-40 synthase
MTNKRNILLTLSYDGTRFCGWQKQGAAGESSRTVQAEVEAALQVIHHEETPLSGSGRTDSGVHAAGQAANFFSPVDSIPVEKYPLILNNLLPPDIRVHGAAEKDAAFHARFSAASRTYRYFIRPSGTPLAHEAPFVWLLRAAPDIARLNAMAACLHGEIDCAAFAAAGDPSPSKKRFMEKAVFFAQGRNIVFEIRANAFLWKMVRSLVGTLVQFEREGRDADFRRVLEEGDRQKAGMTAPPQGLFLWEVSFEGERRHEYGNA